WDVTGVAGNPGRGRLDRTRILSFSTKGSRRRLVPFNRLGGRGYIRETHVTGTVPVRPKKGRGRLHLKKEAWRKAESDLDYIQYRLEYEIKINHPDSAGKKNPITLLKELSAIKSRYQTLHERFKPVAIEQKETKSHICATLNKTMTTIQELQKQTDVEISQSESLNFGFLQVKEPLTTNRRDYGFSDGQ
ncbi:Spindle and kinetochore-associated protein 2, partial [Galemys pyrenaicus]